MMYGMVYRSMYATSDQMMVSYHQDIVSLLEQGHKTLHNTITLYRLRDLPNIKDTCQMQSRPQRSENFLNTA